MLLSRRSLNAMLSAAAFGLTSACVSSPRPEPAGSAATATAFSGKVQPFATPPPQPASPDEQRESQPTQGMMPALQAPAAAPALRRAEPNKAEQSPTNIAPARTRGQSPKAATDKKAGEAMLSRPDDLRPDPLVPNPADPPELRAALEEFQSAADMLTAGHGCDDGCRAFLSMQRSAARICDLVSNRDLTGRCALARAGITAAERDLKERCGTC